MKQFFEFIEDVLHTLIYMIYLSTIIPYVWYKEHFCGPGKQKNSDSEQ